MIASTGEPLTKLSVLISLPIESENLSASIGEGEGRVRGMAVEPVWRHTP
jgi:hypothetical protein